MAGKPNRTSRIARLAGLAITVAGMAFATASWASITSSENPSTDGSYTISWSAVPNAHSHQLYEDGTLVYDSTGTSWSASGKAAGDYEYTVGYCEYIFDEEMCFGSGYTALTVTVSSPAPTVSASFDESSIALGESVELSWSSTNATSCSGSPAIGSTSTSGTKTYTPSSAGTFSVKVTCTGDGGSGSNTASVTVHAPPTVEAEFDESSIALGASVELTWSSSNATACSGSPAIGSTSTSGTKSYTPSSAGTFSVKVTCTGAGGSGNDTASVTVHAPPEVEAEFDESSITLGESVELSWSSENATACSGSPAIGSTSTSGTKEYTPSSSGTFSVTVTCTGPGGSGSDDASVTVNDPPPDAPEVEASFDESSIALGESVTLSWSSTDASSCSGSPGIGSTSTSGTKTYTPTSAGTFRVKVTCKGDGGSGSDTARVTVHAPPTVSASFDESSIALGESVELTWSSSKASSCKGSPGIGSTSTSGTKTYTPTSAGTFRVKVTCTGAGGSGNDTASVTVHAPPTVSASFDESSITLGESAELSWSSTKATSCSGSPSIGSTATSGTKTYTPSSAGSFSVTVTCTGAGGSNNDSASVTVEPSAPTLTVPTTDPDGSYTVSWTSVSGASSYKLEEKSGSGSFANVYSGSDTSRSITGKADGAYSYRVRACTSTCGDWSSTATVNVVSDLRASPNPSADGSYTVSWTPIPNAESYQLYENGTLVYDSTGTTWSFGGKVAGSYVYTLEFCELIFDEEHCDLPSGYESLTVTVTTPPLAPTLTVPATDADGSYTVSWTASAGATSYKLEEKPAGGSFSNVYDGANRSHEITGKTNGTYTYQVRGCAGTDNCGDWSSTASVEVSINNAPVAVDDTAQTPFRTAVVISVLENDTDADGDDLTVTAVTTPANGSVKITSDDNGDKTQVTYTPQSGHPGTDTFDYTVSDGTASDTGTVTVTVDLVTVTPNPSTTGSYTLAWDGSPLLADRYRVTESFDGGTPSLSHHLGTSVYYSGKASGNYYYLVESCETPLGELEECVDRGRATATVELPPNDPPVAGDDTARTPFQTAKVIDVLANDMDANGDDLTVTVVTAPANGTARITSNNTRVTYTPQSGYSGADTFGYTVSDGTETDDASVSVTVGGPPEVEAGFDESVITLGDSVTLTWSSSNTSRCSGIPSIDSTATWGTKTYTPSSAGTFEVTVTCTGPGTSGSASDTVSVTVNTPPVAVDDTKRTAFETAIAIEVLANDSDADGDDLTVTAATDPSNGTAAITADADGDNTLVTYTPQSMYSGTDTFRYTASDGTDTASATVSVTVNTPPTAMDDTAQTAFQTAIVIKVLVNDSDADGDDLTVTAVTTPTNGAAAITADTDGDDTLVTYTPQGMYSGTDAFRYTVSDGTDTASATVSVTVNAPPTAVDDTAQTAFETAKVIEVLANDSDADGDDLTVTAVTTPTNGTAAITADADGDNTLVTYTPQSTYSGADTFRYTVSDGTDTASATVSVTVNTPPTVVNDTAQTAFETAIVIEVLANDSDADGDDLTVTAVTTPTNGTAAVTADTDGDKTLVMYTPQSGYSGTDTFDYTVSDGTDTGTGNVSVTVDAAPPPEPMVTASFDQSSITLGESVTLTWSSTNASQCSGTPSIGSTATSGTKEYTPSITGSFSVTVTCTGAGGSDEDTASVTVTPASTTNTAPVAVDDTAETVFLTAVEIAVLANDTDADGDDLTVTAVTTPANGTVAITSDDDGNNTLVTYTPGNRHPGSDTFNYTVSDGTATDTGTVTVTVGFVKVTPNPSTTGNYTLSWQGTLLADRYRVLESVAGGTPVLSYHLGTSVDYTGKATGDYHYLVERCETPLGQLEECVDLGRVTARVVLPITPGNLPSRSGVTKGGDPYVNVPIAPVPGVNGLAPRLSIDYSGGRDRHRSDQELPADMIGYGWRVGGFSTIRRCVKGEADSDGISFDDTDALCLDGEPLTKISGTHLEAPAEYRTARESFAKVVMKDSGSGDWFEVHLPDGTVREYGRTLDSQLWKPARQASGSDPAEPAAPFLWSINKQTDAFGNLMQYEYYEDNTNLARHPKKITYGNAKDATIEFVYKPRDDLDSTQVGSFSLGQPQRLTYIHLRLGGSLVRDYRLAYKRTSTGQVRLNELQTCGYEPSGTYHCLSPLAIGWQGAASGTWVNQLTDPMGVETTFAIETMSESDPHSFVLAANDTPFGTTSLPANTRALPAKNDTVKPVVTSVTRSDGIGGTRQTSYAYLGRGVENTRNWGFLGFHAIRETDSASGIVTYTQYRLDYPHFGRPAQVVRYHGNYVRPTMTTKAKTPLSKRAVRYAEKSVAHTGSTVKTTLPYAEETMEWLYEGTSTIGAVQTTEALTLASGSGLVTQVVRETRTGHAATGDGDGGSDWGAGQSHTLSGIQRTTQQTLSFDNDPTNWVLGFVNNIGVNHYGPNSGDTLGPLDWTETVGRTRIAGTLAPDVVTRFPGDDLQHRTDYGYDTKGNRKTASETEGVPASNAGGQSSQTANDSARVWEVLGFGAGRFPTSWKNPLNHREYATHHVGLGVPATTTDANNRRTSYAYDGLGREISRTRHWDSVTTTKKDGTKTTEDVKTTTAYAPCDETNTCDAVEAAAAVCGTRYSVAPVMKVTTSAPDMPDSTAYLDMFGRAIRTAVEGFGGKDRRVDAFYDARGRMVCESEPYHAGDEARYTRYAYDIRDRLKRAARPDGGTTAIAYAAVSNRVTATVTETVMAANGNETLAERQTKRTHNVLGELVSTVEGAAEAASKRVTTRYIYDGAGRLKTVTTGDQTTTFAYDAAGNRASVKNPNLGATVNAGDDANRVPASVKFGYNGHGELTERTDARGATYYGYDKLGRRTCAADRGGTATWEYDQTNGTGLLKRRGYDRDTVQTSASNCPFGDDFAETYAYNADARLETVTTSIVDDANATTTLTRRHAYDNYGRLASTTYPSSATDTVTVGYEYNEHGYLEKLKHGETALVEVREQTAYGQSKAETYGNGVRTRLDYDKLGRLKDIDTIRRGGAKIQDNTYAWRSDGSLQRRAARAGSSIRREHFEYDYLNRLTSAATRIGGSATATRTLAFGYDLRGNLTTKTSDVSGDEDTTGYDYYAGTNRLKEATVGDVKYGFTPDSSGHIERYECKDPDENDEVDPCADVDDTFIDWNARGLAEKVTVGDSKTTDTPAARDSFRYGPDGARYFKKSEWEVTSGTTTTLKTSRKYYAGAYEKTVTASGDTVERTRIGDSVVHVRTTPASMMGTPSSVFEYVHRDHLGSVEAVTDASGNELIVLGYDPYGERRKKDWTGQLTDTEVEALLNAQGERVSRGFTRHEHLDRTGLIHMNGRVYDPRLGRFLSPDPIVGDPTSSRSWNLYSYVGNNPLSYVDPTGLVQAGPICPPGGPAMCMAGGGGGGATTRTITVTTTVTVSGVTSVPYRYALPVWTQVWNGDGYAWYVGDEYFWGERSVTQSFSHNVTRTITVPDESVAEEPSDMGGLAMTAADIGASILIPGYDLLRCNMEGDCDWTDWVLGIGEIAVSATGVGYGVRVAAKAGIRGGAKAAAKVGDSTDAATQPNRIYSARELVRRAEEPGPFHNFPESFNREIFEKGARTTTRDAYKDARQGLSNDLVKYRLPGTVNGRDGVYEIFTRPSTSGRTEVIMHRFFRPDS